VFLTNGRLYLLLLIIAETVLCLLFRGKGGGRRRAEKSGREVDGQELCAAFAAVEGAERAATEGEEAKRQSARRFRK
jgi:hypothetical protein